jgi:hypothetical protein
VAGAEVVSDGLDVDELLPIPAEQPAAELGCYPTSHVLAALGRIAEAHRRPTESECDLFAGALGQDPAGAQVWWQEAWMRNGEFAGSLRDEVAKRLKRLRAEGLLDEED